MASFILISRPLLLVLAYSFLVTPSQSRGAHPPSRPNVVIVMTDDQGYGDLGCTGNPVLKTPSIDALQRESLSLTDYHVSPTCSPTRAAFLTGHWANRTGAWHTINGRSILYEDEVTMAELFKRNGYATGMFGKWHLGDNYPFRPTDRGFDEVMCHGGGGIGQTPDHWDNAYFDGTYLHNNQPTSAKGFCTHVFFDYAKSFIEKQKQANKPFLAYIACNAAHSPMHSPPEDAEPYEDQGTKVANFFGMLADVDQCVGELRTLLKQEGLAKNTIFIFTTDNGTAAGSKVYNAGMRGAKGSPYDGGHRVPFLMHWPSGGIDQPKDLSPITAHVDILPTLIDFCQLKTDADLRFDGVSLRQLILHPSETTWEDRIIVTDSQRILYPKKWRQTAVMTSRYRLVNQHELYDLTRDPGQIHDIASNHPDVVKRLSSFYDQWWADLSPALGKFASVKVGTSHESPTRLTCHDWFSDNPSPWNQRLVRSGPSIVNSSGYWNINVVEAGRYEIVLRRWPHETGVAIRTTIPAGPPSHGQKAFRETPGIALPIKTAVIQVAGFEMNTVVSSEDTSVVFEIALPAGITTLTAFFETEEGKQYGAYYVDVEKR